MTPKKLFSADFREIPAIELRCKCGGSISIPLPRNLQPRRDLECPGCYERFWKTDTDPAYRAVATILAGLSDWKKLNNQDFNLGFSIADNPVTASTTPHG